MNSIISLAIAAFLPVVAALGLFQLNKYTKFKNWNFWLKQSIYGVIFGGLAIVGTHWGIPIAGAQVNARDAAVIIGGLFYGWPTGVIAGLIGSIERFFGVYLFGLGSFTQVACSVSTLVAGLASAALRKFLFNDKKPGIISAGAIAFVIEVFHMFMVFVTNAANYQKAFNVVNSCTLPMLLANTLSVVLCATALKVIDIKDNKFKKLDTNTLNSQFQIRMGALIFGAFVLSSLFIVLFQNEMAVQETTHVLQNAISDTSGELALDSIDTVEFQRAGTSGWVAVFDSTKALRALTKGYDKSALDADIAIKVLSKNPNELIRVTLGGNDSYAMFTRYNNYYVVSGMNYLDATLNRNIAIYVNSFLEIIVFALIFLNMYFVVTYIVNKRIDKINARLSKIAEGDLNTLVEGGHTTEFKILAKDINITVNALKEYIAKEKERIDKELAFAKSIQESALPKVFPAFPNRNDFDVYATMKTAKEVGGDFYDFYFTHTNHFSFLIADVSGKGIPAAMFMMRAKSVLKGTTKTDAPIDEVFDISNNNLCKGNEAGMFVTAWQGNVDLQTGLVQYINAGHNPPLVKHKDGKFEYLRSKPNMVLASFDDFPYKKAELQLEKGDIVFLYTDGVTESINTKTEQYGEDRLLKVLNSKQYSNCQKIVETVLKDVEKFVGEAEQFDDITMVAFQYNGQE